jgi:hypothetical protein
MAIWQFTLHLIPAPKLVKHFRDIPAFMDPDTWESADMECWDAHGLPDACRAMLDEVLPRMEDHWCETVSAWGSYDGHIVEVSQEGQTIEWFSVRINLRDANPRLLRAICQIGSTSDCYLLTEDMRLIEPRIERLLEELQQSSAFRFVADPKGFFDSFRGMPRLD